MLKAGEREEGGKREEGRDGHGVQGEMEVKVEDEENGGLRLERRAERRRWSERARIYWSGKGPAMIFLMKAS